MNFLTNFVPHKLGKVDEKDLHCMTEEIKQKIEQKNSLQKHLSNNVRSESDFVQLQSMANELSEIV